MTTNGSEWRREQLRRTLEHWRDSGFDPHIILGVPTGATQQEVINAHRRWVAAYHPDRHGNDPVASELTKRVNASRDALLFDDAREKKRREEQRHREKHRRRQEEARRAREQYAREQEEVRQRQHRMRSRARRHRQRETFSQRNYRPPTGTGFRPPNRRRIHLLIALLALVAAGIVAYIGIAQYRSNQVPMSEFAPTSTPYPTPPPLASTPTFSLKPNPTATHTPTDNSTLNRSPTNASIVGAQPRTSSSGLTEAKLTQAREYVLTLINDARSAAGLNSVILDDNPAAQSHADNMGESCFLSHWGTDGLKPYMRYTLSGGEQHSAENVSGIDFCPTDPDRYIAKSITEELKESMDGLLNSAGHRENILHPHHRKVNIGISYQHPTLWLVQLFVGDYIEFEKTPSIENGVLSVNGIVNNGAIISGDALGLQVYFDQFPHDLTRGQLHNTHCYGGGVKLAQLRPPLEPSRYYLSDAYTESGTDCLDPYDVPVDASAATSYFDLKPTDYLPYTIEVPWVTASEWTVNSNEFAVSADISDLIAQYGNGVYTILVWAQIDGEDVPISEYSIFIPPYDPPP